MSSIAKANGSPISIKILPDMYEVVTGLARTNQLVGVPLIDINLNLETFYSQRLKRFIDLLIGVLGFLICIPIWVFVAILIKLDSRGPVFYNQERMGKNGKIFYIFKFRSMISDAEATTGPVWAGTKDDRVTSVGRLLRRFHFDETPQLINILKGEMIFVGPRPALHNQGDLKTLRTEKGLHKLKPGVTGWAQVNGRDELRIPEKVKLDEYYLQNKSFWLNIKILFMTGVQLLFPKGVSH